MTAHSAAIKTLNFFISSSSLLAAFGTLCPEVPPFSVWSRTARLVQRDAHAAHYIHNFAIFYLALVLFQLLEPSLLLGNFALTLSISPWIFSLLLIAIS